MREELLRVLPFDERVALGDGVFVTAIDANHCPGAAQLLFEGLPGGKRVLHTGDFRFCDAMTLHPALAAARDAGIDAVYLVRAHVADVAPRVRVFQPRVVSCATLTSR